LTGEEDVAMAVGGVQQDLEVAYKVRLAPRFKTVEFLGLPHLKDEAPLSLSDIYVPLSVTWQPAGTERLFIPKAFDESKHLVVLGDPGSGKSTLVKLLAYSFSLIEATPLSRRLGSHLPIPIILREYDVSRWHEPKDMLAAFIGTLDDEIRSDVTPEWLEQRLISGEGILLLDGLDEIGDRIRRERLRDEVVSPLLRMMPKSLALLTSRVVGYEEVPFHEFPYIEGVDNPEAALEMTASATDRDRLRAAFRMPHEYVERMWPGPRRCYVAPFNDEEIDQYVDRWYALREPEARLRQEKTAGLKAAVRRSDRIRRLAGNPSLLTLMALVHRVTSELPSGRANLYGKIVEAYLETIQIQRRLERFDATLDQMKRWLARVGWEMQIRRTKDASEGVIAERNDVRDWLVAAIGGSDEEAKVTAEAFLDYVARRSGLLLPIGEGRFSFAHLSFQEYFAAWYLRGMVRRFDDLTNECARRVEKQHWHETLVLLFELLAEFEGAGDDLIKAMKRRSYHLGATAKLFALVLEDEENGLTREAEAQAAALSLSEVCREFDMVTVGALLQVSEHKLEQLVFPWLDSRIESASPEQIEPCSFSLAGLFAAYRTTLEQKLAHWSDNRRCQAWTAKQMESFLGATAPANPLACSWAAPPRLPLRAWLLTLHMIEISIAEVCLPGLVTASSGRSSSPNLCFLAQTASALTTSRTYLLTVTCSAARNEEVARACASLSLQARQYRGDQDHASSPEHPETHALMWALGRGMNGLQKLRGIFWWKSWLPEQAGSLARLLVNPLIDKTVEPSSERGGLAAEIAQAEYLFANPQKDPQPRVALLELQLTAHDDWTRLLALTALMLLGEASPERIDSRNALLNLGTQQPKRFTFPNDVADVARNPDFPGGLPGLLQHLFLHVPGAPWLKPEWFDRSRKDDSEHPAYFFCASPAEFYDRAAKVLDPEGKTGLADWRRLVQSGANSAS
jgi:hypothetical protein